MDTRAYEKGVLDTKTKEMLGSVASIVLWCSDCIAHHVIHCVREGVTGEEFFEALNVGLVGGGSITISDIRYAVETLDQCRDMQKKYKYLRL